MIATVLVNDQPVDPCLVLADVTILHGRSMFGDTGQPSSATVVVEHPEGSMPTWQSGDRLQLAHDDGTPAFAGRIVARSLAHIINLDGTRVGQFTVTAAGVLALLGVRRIGGTVWPQERDTARAARIFGDAQISNAVQDGPDPYLVLLREPDPQPADGLLDELATWTGAAVYDTPDGEAVYQALSGRTRVKPYMWRDFDPVLTWDGFDPLLTWDGFTSWQSPASEFPVVLPCDAVLWEPSWHSEEAAVINVVSVSWGPEPQAEVDLTEPESITRHGKRHLPLATQLANVDSATDRAEHIITTQHEERWQIGDVTVALDVLPPADRAKVLALQCGDHVTLTGFPQPAPAIDWTGIVEGWAYVMSGDGGQLTEDLTLALSDPMLSLVVMQWSDYAAGYEWAQHPAGLSWDDLETTAVLGA